MDDIAILNYPEVEYIDHMGGDYSIVRAARVSVKGANEVYLDMPLERRDAGLIHYLAREKHGSPFEHTAMTFYVKAPIFVFREFQRHRIASYNEMSGRYTELEGDFYIPTEARPLVNGGTSARPKLEFGSSDQYDRMVESSNRAYSTAWEEYQNMLKDGVANEVARAVLPLGIYSQMYVTMNVRAMFNFLSLRTHREDAAHVSRPQFEIEEVANMLEKDVARLYPVAYAAFNEYGRVAP